MKLINSADLLPKNKERNKNCALHCSFLFCHVLPSYTSTIFSHLPFFIMLFWTSWLKPLGLSLTRGS